ncbi:MAG TPA: hypothetical protein DCZ40_05170 [Lachnospiraceae bacterium]|nr:hypothetical protein [Lachnospiraceae bacterium]
MKVVQIVKKLNNTELGKRKMNDTYVLIPNDLDIKEIFEVKGKPVEFEDKYTHEKVTVKNTVDKEKRITGLGEYYKKQGLSAGDEIIFEKREIGSRIEYVVYVKKNDDILVFQKARQGFEILTPERLGRYSNITAGSGETLEITFLTSGKIRKDSPVTTDFYDIKVSGKSLMDRFSAKELGEIRFQGNRIKVNPFYGWKKYTFETEEE